jgi:hypothetical protein
VRKRKQRMWPFAHGLHTHYSSTQPSAASLHASEASHRPASQRCRHHPPRSRSLPMLHRALRGFACPLSFACLPLFHSGPLLSCFTTIFKQFAATMLAKLLNPPSVVKAESRMTQLHAVEKASPWAAKFGWFNHGRCQKAMALRGMKDNVRAASFRLPHPPHPSLRRAAYDLFCFMHCH